MTRVFVAAAVVVAALAAAAEMPEVGAPAPPVELAASDGSARTLADVDGPLVLIFFRGVW